MVYVYSMWALSLKVVNAFFVFTLALFCLLQREADFLERVASRRASSYSKFEDDYYGENIKSVSDYRQWLREQQKKQNIAEKYDSKEQPKTVNAEAA